MSKEENLKTLKDKLINHEPLSLDWDDLKIILTWDNEISNYRGKTEYCDACIWKIKTLWEIANGQHENMILRGLDEDN